ncbi:hypothetical protein AB0I82_23490 [Streptomyces sp. NPDC050315]|uniref:hypothetical protein n=1 Tax=Streptomyces sp. NPDC050315 TaxID=3155039 RepID=UPI00342D2549
MRRTTVGASAGVLLLLGAALAYCDNSEGPGYIAAHPADSQASLKPVAPKDDVTLVPLDGPDADPAAGTPAGKDGERPRAPADGTVPPSGTPGAVERTQPPATGAKDGSNGSAAPSPPSSPSSPSPTPTEEAPALLEVGTPLLANTDVRWCEQVTVKLHNAGGRPVTDGTLTFATHIIGGLGIDWDTRKSTRDLPTPIAGGETKKHTWKVCVDAWRVPLGMHIDTKDVDATWT